MKLPRVSIVDRLVSMAPEAFGLGRPAVEGQADPRGPVIVQLTVASAGVIIHSGMSFYSGLAGFLWVAVLATIYIVAVIPFSMRVAELDTSLATWVDLVSMTLMAMILGDPAALLAWFPLVVFANLIYVPTVAAVKQLAVMIPLAFAFYVVMSRISDRLFEPDVLRVYLGATLFMWLLSSIVYALSVGGSVSRCDAAVEEAPTIEMELVAGSVLVKDDGPPVPESERERMFQAYERVHHHPGKPDSVGLGLTVCRRLSRLMEGDVTYAHDGSRSVFTLSLPEVISAGAICRDGLVALGEVRQPVPA